MAPYTGFSKGRCISPEGFEMFDALEAEALNQADPNVPIMPVEVPPPPQFSAVIGFDMDALMEQIEDGTDFNEVKTISLKTLVQDTSLQRLGFLMPNLQQLILSGSYLLSLRFYYTLDQNFDQFDQFENRELGTGMNHLTELRVDNCSLRSLDGLSALASLQELHAPHNPVADIWSCSVLPELKILNLSYTQVTNPSQAGFLAPCRSLQALSLFGSPAAGRSNYRSEIARQLPNLTSLDGQPLARGRRSNADGADDDEGEADGESPRARPGRNDRDLASIRVTTDRQSDDDDDGYDTPSK